MNLPNRIGLITLACRDVERIEEPFEAFWGGGFSWRDPEGNIWDVAYAKGTRFDDRGGVFFP